MTDPDCPACDDEVRRWAGGPPGVDDDGPVLPYRPSAAELLEAEAGPLVPTRDRWLVSYLVAELDDRGLLGRLRQLEPFEAQGVAPVLLRPMIAGHLDDLAAGRIGLIAAALGAGEADVVAAREFLRRHLRPSAAPDEPADLPVPAPPDVVIRADPSDPERFEIEVVRTARASTRPDPAWVGLAQAGRRSGTFSGAEYRRMPADAARACGIWPGCWPIPTRSSTPSTWRRPRPRRRPLGRGPVAANLRWRCVPTWGMQGPCWTLPPRPPTRPG